MMRKLGVILFFVVFAIFTYRTVVFSAPLKSAPKTSQQDPSSVATLEISDSFEYQEFDIKTTQRTDSSSEVAPRWVPLQYDTFDPTIFSTSVSQVADGQRSLQIKHKGTSWGSTLSLQLEEPTSGDVSVALYDSLQNDEGYVYLGATIKDYANPDLKPEEVGMSLGIHPTLSKDFYVYCASQKLEDCMVTHVPRTQGWHTLHIVVTPFGSYGKIDNENLSILPKKNATYAINTSITSIQHVNIGMNTQSESSARYFDDFKISRLPSPVSGIDLAYEYIDIFLASYSEIDVSQIDALITARKDDFCPVDYDYDGSQSATQICPTNGLKQRPLWHYKEQLFHVYDALLMTAGAHAIRYNKTHESKDLDKAVEILTYVDKEFPKWSQHETGCQNKHCNTGAIVGLILAHQAWLLWDHLDPSLQVSLADHLSQEAEFFYAYFHPFNGYIGNSGGEENSWTALYLDRLSLAFRSRGQAKNWYDRAKFFAFHALSADEEYDGVRTQNIYKSYLFDNHFYHPHPTYAMVTASSLASMDLLRKKITGESTYEYTRNAEKVWRKNAEYVDFRNFQYKNTVQNVTTPNTNELKYARNLKAIKGARPDAKDLMNSQNYDMFPSQAYAGSSVIFSGVGSAQNTATDELENERINVFSLTGKNDWGADAVSLTQYAVVSKQFNISTYQDSESGFTTDNLEKYSSDFINYMRRGSLWRHVDNNVKFQEMLVEEFEIPGRDDRESYKWFTNANYMWEFAAYVFYFDDSLNFSSLKVCEDDLYKTHIWEGSVAWGCDKADYKDGKESITMTLKEPSNAEIYTPLLNVKPDTEYTVSYWHKSKDVVLDDAQLYGRIIASQYSDKARESDKVNENRLVSGFEYGENTSESTAWVRKSYTFRTQPGTKYVRLRAVMGMGKGSGTFWFDGISLSEKRNSDKPDANDDAKIDGIDYVTWLRNFSQQTSAGAQSGDFDNNGVVDNEDFTKWYEAYEN